MANKKLNKWGRFIESFAQRDIAPHSIFLKGKKQTVKTNVRVYTYPLETTNLCLHPDDTGKVDNRLKIQLQDRAFPIGKDPISFRRSKDSFSKMNDAVVDAVDLSGAVSGPGSDTGRNIIWSIHPSRLFDSSRDDRGRTDPLLKGSGSLYCPRCKTFVSPSKTEVVPGGNRVCFPRCKAQDVSESPYMTRD
jgi:hypothetical protein